jgi:hypothetical protein
MNETKIELTGRLRRESRWEEAANFKETERADFRSKGMNRKEAGEAAWSAMEEAYPPLPESEPTIDSVRIQGLSDIPESWGDLPSNANLQAELSWCQANRLRVVEEKSSGATVVSLDKARSPAPSWAALGWLETSIRSYSKYVDIVAKSLKDEVDEQANVRRERASIEEIRELLDEMHRDSPD